MSELILITGVSGHIGFRVLAEALQNGYRARAVVRKEAQIEEIKEKTSIKPYASQVEFALVTDLGADNAFDAHVDGVSYIIHIASPKFASAYASVNVAEFVKPTLKITNNILTAASKAKSVKRVVITSSITTLFTGVGLQGNSDFVYDWKTPVAKDLISPTPEEAVGPTAYIISKVLAARAVLEYVESNKPHYSVANILPGTTIGRNELASDSKELRTGANMVALAPLLNIPFPPIQSVFTHIDDAALSHIRALRMDILPGTARNIINVYGTASNPDAFSWDDSVDIVKQRFPGALESGTFPLGGSVPKLRTLIDSSEDERVLGMKFRTYEEAVIDLVGQFLQLAQPAQK
ncbi:putative 3-beta hydroxysteroid dehydrogenase/isomerase [Gymnopus androsaceus JB14]|uniref:3-beta hydroxysteroid dehydrogenase/isomerase n=1 Tax=Gymnopus androsaceus JB14 TaxID=1447944 RepID=A0A6A4GNJ7_9AGAR|nr:putative 3-beta hydroxysteroid dehydrogenase/isomerase [Gymnopus androsaceus JB14]